MSRVRENRTHGSMGRGWKRAACYWHVEMGAVGKPFGMSATAYGSYRASLLPDLSARPTWRPPPRAALFLVRVGTLL